MDCLLNVTQTCSGLTDVGGLLLLQLFNNLLTSKYTTKPEYPADRSHDYLPEYDFIVVGSGSGGSAVAAGLARHTQWKVLLIEAGDDPDLASEIPFIFYSRVNSTQDFGYLVEPQENSCRAFKNNQCVWPRGKVLGGCTAMNAMVYNQGNPRDYDDWARLGNVGWDWEGVKKYYDDQMNTIFKPKDYESDDTDILTESQNIILDAGKQMGFEVLTDREKVSRGYVGFYKVLGTVQDGRRNNAAKAFLIPVAKQANFHVIKNAFVTKILLDGKQVRGVEVFLDNRYVQIGVTKEVILSAGAINTPQTLLLSGIGPKQHLAELGIQVVQDLPVGLHLQDHPNVMLPTTMFEDTSEAYQNLLGSDDIYKYFTTGKGILSRVGLTNILTYMNPKNPDSKVGEISHNYILFPTNDQVLLEKFVKASNFKREVIARIMEANKNRSVIFVYNVLLRPKSEGVIRLRSTNPFDPPIIDPNSNSVAEDLDILLGGIRHTQKLFQTPLMRKHKAKFIQFDLDECKSFAADSDDYWICVIKHFTATLYHPAGTTRMGTGADSVIDPRLRVHGIRGLRVADCSVMPKLVGGNTNAPCMMIGAKAADLIRTDWLGANHGEL